jgi:superfamily II DNA/RNA helicase
MFDMGFIDDVRAIISYLPTDRDYQKMGFSATSPRSARPALRSRRPFIVDSRAAGRGDHAAHCVRRDEGRRARESSVAKPGPTLIFTETKLAADKV